MKQKKCFWAVAATMLLTAASFTSCSNQDNIVAPNPTDIAGPDEFDEGSLVVNGRFEGNDVSNYLVQVGPDGSVYKGAPTIKWDEVTPRNHAAVVEVRSEGEARSAGNATLDNNGNFVSWDSQFFITIGKDQVLEKGDQIRLTMKVKADEAANGVETQSHAAAGVKDAYLHWFCVGNVNFTTDWTDFDSGWINVAKADANNNFPWGQAAEGTYTIAFNLAKGIRNRYFFDDIRVEVKRHDKWADDNILTNGRLNEEDMKCFTSQEWINGEKIAADPNKPGNARRVVDVTNPDNMCIEVIARDPEGASIDAWDSQFFVTFPEKLIEGDKVKFEMRVRADKAAKISTQAHAMPTQYIHYVGVGDINATTEWTTFEKEFTVTAQQAKGNAGEFQTIAFNLAELKEANKYYFDDIKLSIIEKAKPVENWETLCEYKGDDAKNFSVKYFKNYLAATSADGAIVVESLDPEKTYSEYFNADADPKIANDHDVQFLIPLPKALAKGTKMKVTMKIKADKAASAASQAHGAIPAAGAIEGKDGYGGSYLHYQLMGNVDFTTDWADYDSKEFTVPDQADGMQSICLNLEVLRAVNKYYFKEIKVEVGK